MRIPWRIFGFSKSQGMTLAIADETDAVPEGDREKVLRLSSFREPL